MLLGDEHVRNARNPYICIASCLVKVFILLVFFVNLKQRLSEYITFLQFERLMLALYIEMGGDLN